MRAARKSLPQVEDESRRQELALLLDKASKDGEAGRKRLQTLYL